MNRTYQVLSITAIALTVMVAACRKTPGPSKNDPFVPSNTTSPSPDYYPTPKSLTTLFKDVKTTPQVITVPAGITRTVYGTNGTRLKFYPNSFKDANGKVITSGDVTVTLIEMYKPGAMIANRASTSTATGEQLESGGQIYIEAKMNGQPVYANKYSLGFAQASASTKNMSLFYGKASTANKGSATSNDGVITWVAADATKPGTTAVGTIWSVPDSTSGGSGGSGIGTYTFNPAAPSAYSSINGLDTGTSGSGGSGGSGGGSGGSGGSGGGSGGSGGSGGGWAGSTSNRFIFDSCTDFGWVNCDRFGGVSGPKTNIKVVVTDAGFNESNTEVFYVIPSINSVMDADNYNVTDKTFGMPSWSSGIPVGYTINIVVMTKQSDTYYYYEQKNVVVTNAMIVNAYMQKQSLDSVKIKLSNL